MCFLLPLSLLILLLKKCFLFFHLLPKCLWYRAILDWESKIHSNPHLPIISVQPPLSHENIILKKVYYYLNWWNWQWKTIFVILFFSCSPLPLPIVLINYNNSSYIFINHFFLDKEIMQWISSLWALWPSIEKLPNLIVSHFFSFYFSSQTTYFTFFWKTNPTTTTITIFSNYNILLL